MPSAAAIHAEIVKDLGTLRAAYERAGFLSPAAQSEMAGKLLGAGEDGYRFLRDFLLVDAVFRNRVACLVLDSGPLRHVAVFGGNNVGKSSVINILAETSVASTSPEGGHTQHPQAFTAAAPPLFGANPYVFRDFGSVRADALNRNRHDRYAVTPLASKSIPPDVVLWDTPDCDAVGSQDYLPAVVETIAAADVVIYVTGLSNYANAHVVEWVFRLYDAGIPIVGCLNRTERKNRELVIRKQQEEIFPNAARQLNMATPALEIVPLRFLSGDDAQESDLWGPEHAEAGQLREAVLAKLKSTDRGSSGRLALDFVQRRINRILEPARMELKARKGWSAGIDGKLQTFVKSYEDNYLIADQTIDPFKRLKLEMLELLDPNIPGLKPAIATMRTVLNFPARAVIYFGGKVYEAWANRDGKANAPVAPEREAYRKAHQELLDALSDQIRAERNAPRHHPFWDALEAEWERQLPDLHRDFTARVDAHMQETDAEIKQAARDIIQRLEDQPAILNTLRTARVASQVGGVVAGFVIPGKGTFLYDLMEEAVLVPAFSTATEQVTSAAVSTYVGRRKDQILDKLRKEARELARSLYQKRLVSIAASAMAGAGALAVGQDLIDRLPAQLEQLEAQLSG